LSEARKLSALPFSGFTFDHERKPDMVLVPNILKALRTLVEVIVEARQARLDMLRRYPGISGE
jgi:hypothetical protein